jgi:hypothetical protein
MESGDPAPVRDRRIALLKPARAGDVKVAHAVQLLTSMLWAFRGTTRSNWLFGPPEDADVIVCHRGEADERIATWRAAGKLIVEIVTNESPESPPPNTLLYPFRAATALALLEQLDDQITLNETSPPPRAPLQTTDTLNVALQGFDDWAFVEGLRGRSGDSRPEEWLVAYTADARVLWAKPSDGIYMAEQPLVKAMRDGQLRPGELRLLPTEQPPPTLHSRPILELLWFSAYHAAAQLAPWLSETSSYRLARWPNFGLIRPAPEQLRVAAILANSELDVGQLARRMQISPQEAARTMNALSVCDSLDATSPSRAAAAVIPAASPQIAPRGGFVAFLRNVRKHLGLKTDE